MTRIFHIALESDWHAARRTGRYTTSTRGRTLAEEGFIHASRGDQWREVHQRYYADVTEPLRLLVIDTDRLDVPVVDEQPAGAQQAYPHIYGPLDPAAVMQAVPISRALEPTNQSFGAVFLREVIRNLALGMLLLATTAGGVLVGQAISPSAGVLGGLIVGIAVGIGLIVAINRRRS